MAKKVNFVVKARGEYADTFRNAFKKMDAYFTEQCLDAACIVVRFDVKCDADRIDVLSVEVPVSAYASVAFTSPPPIPS